MSARSRTNRLFFATEITEGTEIKFELLAFSIHFILCLCSFKKTYPLYTLHELARLMQKSGIFLGVKNGKSLLGKE